MNHFNTRAAAQRYSKGRPDFHSNTIKHIKAFLRLDQKLDNALDIACGTGLSTKALLEIATTVYGTDTSREMLNLAPESDKIHYSIAPAEQQPFANNYFDIITVSSGIHWFDIETFLLEANRLLKSKSWLVLYENHFIAEMVDNDRFTHWFHNVYLKSFPSPPRHNNYPWTDKNLLQKNFSLAGEETFKNGISFNKGRLVLYFTTQTNIIAAVQRNQTNYPEVEKWLDHELDPFFNNPYTSHIINYGNWIKYIQRVN